MGLSDTLTRNPEFEASVTDIIDAWNTISTECSHPLLAHQAEVTVQEMRNCLREIASGEIRTGVSDVRPLSVVIDEAKERIRAISMISMQWWNSPIGKRYWERNEAAIARGVRITRIFIVHEADEGLNSLMQQMHTAGVQVLCVGETAIPQELCDACVIADETLVWTTAFDQRRMPREQHFSTKYEDIVRAVDRFDKLMEYAQDYGQTLRERDALSSAGAA